MEAAIGERQASLLAISIALLGLAGLYFFGQSADAREVSPAMVAIMEDGAIATVVGSLEGIEEKETTFSLKVCDAGGCVSVSAQKALVQGAGIYEGARISVFGEVSSYKGAKFFRAQKLGFAGG